MALFQKSHLSSDTRSHAYKSYAVTIMIVLIISKQGALHFNFSLDLTNYIVCLG